MSSVTLVISDVHANQWALDAVLNHAERFKYDEIWFLGALWGYGPSPYEVWEKLLAQTKNPIMALAGNHDWEICGLSAGNMRPEARDVITLHRQFLSRRVDVLERVRNLPVMCSPRPGVYLAHGEVLPTCAQSIRSYLYRPTDSPDVVAENFKQAVSIDGDSKVATYHSEALIPARLFAIGQTHEQKLWVWDADGRIWRERIATEYSLSGIDEHPVGLNPGSVGFPRADSGCPSYAIIDWNTNMLFFQRAKYDTTRLKQAMTYPPYQTLIHDTRFFIEPHCQETI